MFSFDYFDCYESYISLRVKIDSMTYEGDSIIIISILEFKMLYYNAE